jgi:DNA-binding Lrp family transcriptional regulator
MHAQPEASQIRAADRATEALRLLSEQATIPLDQLARFLDLNLEQGVRVAQRLEEEGLVETRRFLVRDYPWLWPSRRGAREAATGFPHSVPDVAMLAHRRAVNEVRLHITRRAPEARWICSRSVAAIPPRPCERASAAAQISQVASCGVTGLGSGYQSGTNFDSVAQARPFQGSSLHNRDSRFES